MAFNRVNLRNLLFIYTILSLFALSLQDAHPRNPPRSPSKPLKKSPPRAPIRPPHAPRNPPRGNRTSGPKSSPAGGTWTVLLENVGLPAMHMQLLHNNKIVIFDRTDFGPSNVTLPPGKCRPTDDKGGVDCTAHSVVYDIPTNTYRPLYVHTNVWCSSGAVHPDGTLVQTGGYAKGETKIRLFKPCDDKEHCDWIEHPQDLSVKRWYASNQILPDGRVIILGGADTFSYEFFPKDPINQANLGRYDLPFLQETTDKPEPDNLYPGVHLMPDGNLYIFANRRSILFDYVNNRVIKEFPRIPGVIRTYPCTGSSVLLPMKLSPGSKSPDAEIMICGGTKQEAPMKARDKKIFLPATKSCGRLRVTDRKPRWAMEEMPIPRTIPDMIVLPSGDVIIINGAKKGSAGWEMGEEPVLNPVLYKPNENDRNRRFKVMNPTKHPRMYHSAATLLPDGRVVVGGSNPHEKNDFKAKYPTDLSLEAFAPDYMASKNNHLRPTVQTVETKDNVLKYGQKFQVKFSLQSYNAKKGLQVVLHYPAFSTHSSQMSQRMLVLSTEDVKTVAPHTYGVTVEAPVTSNIAPPGYYMLFVVNAGIPSHSVWVKVNNN